MEKMVNHLSCSTPISRILNQNIDLGCKSNTCPFKFQKILLVCIKIDARLKNGIIKSQLELISLKFLFNNYDYWLLLDLQLQNDKTGI